MLYIITDDKGEQRREIESSDVESAALDWARRVGPRPAHSEEGRMDLTVTGPDGVAVPVELTFEVEVTYYAMRLDD